MQYIVETIPVCLLQKELMEEQTKNDVPAQTDGL